MSAATAPLFPNRDLFAEIDRESEPVVTLPHSARTCYELFADVERWPEWLPIIQRVRVLAKFPQDRPRDVSLTVVVARSMMGSRVSYGYSQRGLSIEWSSHPASLFQFAGKVSFAAAGEGSAVMRYHVATSFAADVQAGPPPDAASFAHCFRDFAERAMPSWPQGSAPHAMPSPLDQAWDAPVATGTEDLPNTVLHWLSWPSY